MAEKTEITLAYMREFRADHIDGLLRKLRDQRDNLDQFIDEKDTPRKSIRAGNRLFLGEAGKIEDTINNSVVSMRKQIQAIIDQFEEMRERLEEAEFRFAGVEEDAALTARDLAQLIDPESAGAIRP
ncbi:hypothetical protein [Nocardiopsis sp. MG754419]|uniref:hypothetical protein n=1 Tax=Nocardiopsis sp. MG754419 TaxID=2259865 RepID=UPI001BA5EBAB|nr:hypothetical protein [Nocardiopsis sp. MG754419]MBR8743373.1 hypothetical protein [Nocardiopsis sp. MG754419]